MTIKYGGFVRARPREENEMFEARINRISAPCHPDKNDEVTLVSTLKFSIIFSPKCFISTNFYFRFPLDMSHIQFKNGQMNEIITIYDELIFYERSHRTKRQRRKNEGALEICVI